MQVEKRNSTSHQPVLEPVRFDKISERISYLLFGGLDDIIDPVILTQKIANRLYSGIKTSEIDQLVAQLCASMITVHPYFGVLASRIVVDDHQKRTPCTFAKAMIALSNNQDKLGERTPLVSDEIIWAIENFNDEIETIIDYKRDFLIDFFGFKTLEKGYLLKINGECVERPQHMFMRVALGIHMISNDMKQELITNEPWQSYILNEVKGTYDHLSLQHYTHATPTLFHAGTPRPQLSSCFLLDGSVDSVEGIYGSITNCAKISKWAGGIGLHISGIRANKSYIRKTGGHSDGIMPMLRVYNDTARYINQSGKRPGSFAMYLEPWHADIFTFLDAKKFHGQEEERARDLFYALWIPDEFMRRVEADSMWTLMCPDECPGLANKYGKEFDELYKQYEDSKRGKKVVKAREIWNAIISAQVETGTPYMLYKDSCNSKSNQQNLGTIKCSNLCAEIVEYSTPEETAACNLASICLSKILKYPEPPISPGTRVTVYTKSACGYCRLAKALLRDKGVKFYEISLNEELRRKAFFKKKNIKTLPQIQLDNEMVGGYTELWNMFKPIVDYSFLGILVTSVTQNLNKIIDKNFYPVPESEKSNFRHRPIGIGIQGLADLFIEMRTPFESEEAMRINCNIFETMYYYAIKASHVIACKKGRYETFAGSPLSQGKFQFDLWDNEDSPTSTELGYNWEELREKVMRDGVRNSLLIALMPTASTSQIMGNNECFEPFTSNLYTRRTLAGEYTVINKRLVRDLINLDLWTEDTKDNLVYHRGSVQYLQDLPKILKNVYKTVWEISQKSLILLAAKRARFVCQSQSLNLWFAEPTFKQLSNAHMFGWKQGLKTGSYYVRSKPALNSQAFTIDPEKAKRIKAEQENEECLLCSS